MQWVVCTAPLLFLASRIGKKSLAKTKHNITKRGGKVREKCGQFRLRSGFESINQYKGKSKGVDDKNYCQMDWDDAG